MNRRIEALKCNLYSILQELLRKSIGCIGRNRAACYWRKKLVGNIPLATTISSISPTEIKASGDGVPFPFAQFFATNIKTKSLFDDDHFLRICCPSSRTLSLRFRTFGRPLPTFKAN